MPRILYDMHGHNLSMADLMGVAGPPLMMTTKYLTPGLANSYTVRELQEAVKPIRTSLGDVWESLNSHPGFLAELLRGTKSAAQKMLDMSDSDIANKIKKIQTQYFTE